MRPWQFAVMGLACLVMAGCRTDPNIALLERELRLQEDEIYRLRGVVEDYELALQSCRGGGALPAESDTGEPGLDQLPGLPRLEGVPSASEIRSLPDGTYGDPRSEAPRSPYGERSGPSGMGEPDGPSEDGPAGHPGDLELRVPGLPGADGAHDGVQVNPASGTRVGSPGGSSPASRLLLNRSLTGGYDMDGRPGDDGITLAVELLDDRGRSVRACGEVAVVVLDPALEGDDARVARWDFSIDQRDGHVERTAASPPMRIELPWPARPPIHSELYLFVRCTSSDGRIVQAEGPIQVALPVQPAGGWVPAEPGQGVSEASLSAGLAGPDRIAARPDQLTPGVRAAVSSSPLPPPAGAQIERPAWSPYRE